MKIVFKLATIGIIMIIASTIARLINIMHWKSIDWNPLSYHPLVPIFGIIACSCYLLILHKKGINNTFLWLFGVIGLAYTLILFGMIYAPK